MFLNMKLLAQHTLNGFGGMGEGMTRVRQGLRGQGMGALALETDRIDGDVH